MLYNICHGCLFVSLSYGVSTGTTWQYRPSICSKLTLLLVFRPSLCGCLSVGQLQLGMYQRCDIPACLQNALRKQANLFPAPSDCYSPRVHVRIATDAYSSTRSGS